MRRKLLFILNTLILLSFVISQSFAQLSVVRKPDHTISLVATPPDVPSSVQVSDNLHLWVDAQNPLTDVFTVNLDPNASVTRFYRMTANPPDPDPIRVVMIGDSMTADCCGWGGGMYPYFNSSATVINYAQPWTGTKIFLQSAEYDKMLLIKPKYVLMQFGYIDYSNDPDRGTTPQEFNDNMRSLVQTIRGFDGIPVLITLHTPRDWDSNGKLIPWDNPYNAITRQIAAELNTPLIDLYKSSIGLFTKLGEQGCAFMTFEPGDNMHVSHLGAVYMSQIIAQAFMDELGPYLTQAVIDPPPPAP